jgi:hypothetical protein
MIKLNRIVFTVFTLSLSGCYLGNYRILGTSSQSANSSSSDGVSGFYVTEPQSLKFYATFTNTIERAASTSLIPNLLSQRITNPVALLLQDANTGAAILAAPTGTDGFPVTVDRDMNLTYNSSTSPQTLWLDPNCKRYLQVGESGKVTKDPSITNPSGNTHRLSGSLQLTVQVIYQFQGDCAPSLQSIYQCYMDSSQCGGTNVTANLDLQALVVRMFAPWIESQTIQISDIPHLSNYAYEVEYR